MHTRIAALLAVVFLALGTSDAAAAWEGLGDLGPASSTADGTRQAAAGPVAIAPYGRSVFVWQQDQSVLARGVKPSGELDWLRVVATGADEAVVAIDGNGTATVAWLEFNDPRLKTRTISAGGKMSDVTPVSTPDVRAGVPELRVTPSGYALFMWGATRDVPNADGFEVVQTRSRSNGVFGPVQNVAVNRHASGHTLFPHMAMRSNGDAVFVWFRFGPTPDRIRSRRRKADGTLAPIRTVASEADGGLDQLGLDLAVGLDSSGVATFAFLNRERVLSRIGRGAVRPVSLAGERAFLPQLAIDGEGDQLFMWQTPGWTKARSRSAGGAFAPVQKIAPDSTSPGVAVSRTGKAVFVWMRVIETSLFDEPWTIQPRARTRSAGGVLGPPHALSDAVMDRYPRVAAAMSAKGRAAAMFDAGDVERGALGP